MNIYDTEFVLTESAKPYQLHAEASIAQKWTGRTPGAAVPLQAKLVSGTEGAPSEGFMIRCVYEATCWIFYQV